MILRADGNRVVGNFASRCCVFCVVYILPTMRASSKKKACIHTHTLQSHAKQQQPHTTQIHTVTETLVSTHRHYARRRWRAAPLGRARARLSVSFVVLSAPRGANRLKSRERLTTVRSAKEFDKRFVNARATRRRTTTDHTTRRQLAR